MFSINFKHLIWLNVAVLFSLCNQSYAQPSKTHVALTTPGGGSSTGMDAAITPRTDLISHSPNAASLGKYGIIPVNLYTGIPNISIPLGEVAGRELRMPITLSYNNNGNRVGEESSWVGAGWALQVGGVITRIVRDKLDEQMTGSQSYDTSKTKFFDKVDSNYLDVSYKGTGHDNEPDLYSFNFGNYSGKFIIVNGKVQLLPFQKLKITGSPTSGFIIVTEDGTIYNFHEKERTRPKNVATQGYNIVQYYSAWHLNSITSADRKDVISLQYSDFETITHAGTRSQQYNRLDDKKSESATSSLSPITTSFPTFVDTKRLISIHSSKMNVSFIVSGDRKDIDGQQSALMAIQYQPYNQQEAKVYNFSYSYFGDTNGPLTCSLKLNSVTEGNGSNVYKFVYKGNGSPHKVLASTDHWGYWNTGNSDCLIPREYYSYGANREPTTNQAMEGILTKLIYPTGGCSVFEYEQNLVYDGKNYVMQPKSAASYINRTNTNERTVRTIDTSFSLNTKQWVKVTYTRNPKVALDSDPNGPNGINAPAHNQTPEVKIIKVVDGDGFTPVFSGTIGQNAQNIGKTDSVSLEAGSYLVQITCDELENNVSAEVDYRFQTDQPIEGKAGPGLRIKNILSYTDSLGTGTPVLAKRYTYTDNSGFSSGILNKPANYDIRTYKHGIMNYNYTEDTYTVFGSSINASLGAMVDQMMYYASVYEKDIDYQHPTDYHSSQSLFGSYDGGPNLIFNSGVYLKSKTDYKTVAGQLIPVSKQEYKYKFKIDSTYGAIKPYITVKRDIVNGWTELPPVEYAYESYFVDPSWRYLASQREVSYFNSSDSVVTTTNFMYDGAPSRNLLLTTKPISNGYQQVTRYKYPESYSAAIAQPLIDKHVLSPVLEQQTWLKKSAGDSSIVHGLITELDTALATPKKVYTLKLNGSISALNSEAKDANGQFSILLSDTRYEQRILNDYDSSSGVLVAQDMLGSSTTKQVVYLWGYQNNLPIAQVHNAAITAVAYTGFEEDNTSWSYNAANVVNTDAKTGYFGYAGTVNKSNIPLGQYTVSFWAKGSGNVTVGSMVQPASGDWKLYEVPVDNRQGNTSTLTINTNGVVIDDLRLCPQNAQMSTFTYNLLSGMTSQTDAKGQITLYEYDTYNRLMNIRDQNGKLLKHYDYHALLDYSNGGVIVN